MDSAWCQKGLRPTNKGGVESKISRRPEPLISTSTPYPAGNSILTFPVQIPQSHTADAPFNGRRRRSFHRKQGLDPGLARRYPDLRPTRHPQSAPLTCAAFEHAARRAPGYQ